MFLDTLKHVANQHAHKLQHLQKYLLKIYTCFDV